MAVKLRKLSGPLLCSQLPWERFWRLSAELLWVYPLCHRDQSHCSETSLAKGGMNVAGGCSFFRNETRQMVFTDLTFCVTPLLSCQLREWCFLCVSLFILSGPGGEEGWVGLQLRRCEYKARTAAAENIPHETESQQEQCAPVGMECTLHRAMGRLSAER